MEVPLKSEQSKNMTCRMIHSEWYIDSAVKNSIFIHAWITMKINDVYTSNFR